MTVEEVYSADKNEEIDHLMCSHSWGMTFFEALYELADRTKSVIYWPSSGPWAAVTDVVTLTHPPPDAFATNGEPPAVVADAKELQEMIFGPD